MSNYGSLMDASAPAAEQKQSGGYGALMDDDVNRQNQALRGTLSQAVTGNPDQYNARRKVAGYLGYPVAAIEALPELEGDAKVRRVQEDIAQSPVLQKRYTNADFARLAHDDSGVLSGIEKAIGGLASYVMGARQGGGLPGLVGSGARSAAAGFGPGLGASAYGAAAFPFEALGINSVGGFLRNEQRAAGKVADRVAGPMPEDANVFERGILSGMRSAGQSVATLPIGLAGSSSAMLATMGGLTFGQSYGKARDKGASVGVSGLYAMEDATAEIVTERFFGAAKLIGDAKAGMGAAKMFMRDIAREVPGEMGATLWQNFNEWSNLNPEKSLAEFVSEQPAALAETIIATVVGGGAQVGAIRGIQKAMGDRDRETLKAQQAVQFATDAEALNKLGAASMVAGRDAETFREFVAQVADEQGEAPTELYVDGEALMNTLNQSGISREELAAIAPVVAGQIDAALTGGMVRVPVSEFMAAGEKITAPLVDYLRSDAQAMNRLEAAEFMKTEGATLQAAVEAELSKQGEASQFRESLVSVQTQFEAELNTVGRFSKNVNKAYAGLLANFYGATAARLGMQPQELLDKYRLRVASKNEGGAQTLNQSDTTAPAFKAWFGESKVVDAQGKPLVVYHGTDADIEAFKKPRKRANDNSFARDRSVGSFFTSDPIAATFFAYEKSGGKGGERVMPSYLALRNPLVVDSEGRAKSPARVIEWSEKAKREGRDGLVIRNVRDGNNATAGDVFVVFKPEQIKSAIGNRGSYDPSDPNILNQSAKPTPEVIELRKRESVLKSLLECMNG